MPASAARTFAIASDAIAVRVARVLEAIWGVSTTFSSVSSSRIELRLVLEHVEPRRRQPTAAQRINQRSVVNHAAARNVDQCRAALHLCELCRANDVMHRRRVRHDQHQMVGLTQQRFQVHMARACFICRSEPGSVVIDDRHPESTCPARDGAPDTPHAENAERAAADVGTGKHVECPALPFTLSQPAF